VSQVRLYLDEDSMRRSLVFGLRARVVDVLTAAEAAMINRQDEDHLTAASAAGRAIHLQHRRLLRLASKLDELGAYSCGHYCRTPTAVLGRRRVAADHAAGQPLPSRTNAKPVGVSLLVGLTLCIPGWKVNTNNGPNQRDT
jgi:hypothetical protein